MERAEPGQRKMTAANYSAIAGLRPLPFNKAKVAK